MEDWRMRNKKRKNTEMFYTLKKMSARYET